MIKPKRVIDPPAFAFTSDRHIPTQSASLHQSKLKPETLDDARCRPSVHAELLYGWGPDLENQSFWRISGNVSADFSMIRCGVLDLFGIPRVFLWELLVKLLSYQRVLKSSANGASE